MKYRPEFPDRFGSQEHARAVCGSLLGWYNTEHHHSGLGFLTPHDVHYGLAEEKFTKRATVLRAAYEAHPERFPLGVPSPRKLPEAVWINKPKILEAEPKIDAPTASQSDDLHRPRVKVLPVSGNDLNPEEVMTATERLPSPWRWSGGPLRQVPKHNFREPEFDRMWQEFKPYMLHEKRRSIGVVKSGTGKWSLSWPQSTPTLRVYLPNSAIS